MALKSLSEIRAQIGLASLEIRKQKGWISPATISKLKTSFPELKFEATQVEATTSAGRLIVFPYDWFKYGAAAVPFYLALMQYKELAMLAAAGNESLVDDAREVGNISQTFKDSILKIVGGDFEDANKIEQFLTDYSSWGGGKSIARSQDDFQWSPIIGALGLLAASSSYVVDICLKLVDLPDLLEALTPQSSFEDQSRRAVNLNEKFAEALKDCGFFKHDY